MSLFLRRDSFPYEQQFNILMRFIVDQTQTPNLKVKVAILRYIEALARQMDPVDFVNSSETRLAVSRIITWTTEPKSSDVRKVGGGPRPFRTDTTSCLFVVISCFYLCCFLRSPRPRRSIPGRGRSSQVDPALWPLCLGRATWRRGVNR